MFQRFSRQQEAMHFADGMNSERRACAQVRPPIAFVLARTAITAMCAL